MTLLSRFAFLFLFLSYVATSKASSSFGGACNGYRQNPSVFNFKIGRSNAKIISDGRLLFNVTDVYREVPFLVKRALKRNFQSPNPIIFENNLLYIDTGRRKLLFDTGNSYLRPDTAGFLFPNLEAEGIRLGDITDIFINHGHFDHIGGLLLPDTKEPAFPQATVHINRREWDFWSANPVPIDELDVPEESQKFLVETAKFVFGKIEKQVKLFNYDDEVAPGVTAVAAPWHTPGHTSFKIEKDGDVLFYAGDAFGIESTSINNPWFRLRFDLDKDGGAEGRVKLLERLAQEKTLVVGYHGTFPGLGRIVENDLTFDFKPVNWEFSAGVETKCRRQ